MDPDARQEPDVEQTMTRLEAEVRRLQDPMEFTEPEVRAARRKLKQLIPVISSTKDGRSLTERARRLKVELQRLAPEQVPRQPQRGRPGGSEGVYAHPRPRDAELAHWITHGGQAADPHRGASSEREVGVDEQRL